MAHRAAISERTQFLHASSWSRGDAARNLFRVASARGERRPGWGLLFVLPGAVVVLALAFIYAVLGNVPAVEAIFLGVKAAVLVIVVEALLRISKRALKRGADWAIAAMSFAAIFFFDAPFPLIILGAALIGFALRNNNAPPQSTHDATVPLSRTGVTIILWLGIWLVPLTVIALALGPDHVLTQTGLFFSKLAVVTFGGAYAVLAYMAQQAVETYGWLSAGEMLDGLGLAETTPGPLILVTEFVGTLAAFRSGSSPAWSMALAGAAVTLWATFAPCFLWIFAGAPYVERIGSSARLSGALSGVTAAVVGVILNLSLWFALHVLFAKVTPVNHGPLRLWTPDFTTFDWLSGALAVLAVILLLWRHWGVVAVLAICAGLGLALKMAF